LTLTILEKVSLQPYNSLALPAEAEFFCAVDNQAQLLEALAFARARGMAVTPLGGGSNLVLAGDIAGLVMLVQLKGVSHRLEKASVDVTFAAGENWHDQVQQCLQQGWYGLENLSLIPGNMGAAAIQNIGAYGVELADRFVSLNAIDKQSGEMVEFDKAACDFGYRDSLFKNTARDRYIIVDICLRLSLEPQINIDYPALQAAVDQHLGSGAEITPALVSAMVCQIRSEKLPDPNVIANAGSFFKNPIIPRAQAQELSQQYPQMPRYPQANGDSKVPAGWLIEQCGFKGAVRGSVGVHQQQALVLINFGGGSGAQLLALADELCTAVLARFSIQLEIEPRVYGS
jgi:UDP-N-acetylmuramate dehydrogenase